MVAADDAPNYARRLGIQKDQVVQELGWDEDTDDDIRADIEEACGSEMLDEDADEVIDQAECADDLGGGGEERYDAHRLVPSPEFRVPSSCTHGTRN